MEYVVFLSFNLMPLFANPSQLENPVSSIPLTEVSPFWKNATKEKEEPASKRDVALIPVREKKTPFTNISKVDLNRTHYNFQTALAKLF